LPRRLKFKHQTLLQLGPNRCRYRQRQFQGFQSQVFHRRTFLAPPTCPKQAAQSTRLPIFLHLHRRPPHRIPARPFSVALPTAFRTLQLFPCFIL